MKIALALIAPFAVAGATYLVGAWIVLDWAWPTVVDNLDRTLAATFWMITSIFAAWIAIEP